MEKKMNYDVFISYRRDGGAAYARMMDLAFRLLGTRPFLDREELKSGFFDEAIYDHIEHSRYFVFILSKGSLDRCNDGPEDWVRKELEKALATFPDSKRIIVVTPEDTVSWPECMPESLNSLRRIQGHSLSFDGEDFVYGMKKLLRECLRDVETDESRRLKEEEKAKKRNEFYERAYELESNDGKIDKKEREELGTLASKLGLLEPEANEMIDKAVYRYEQGQRKIRNTLLYKTKRIMIRASVVVGVMLISAILAWFNGYRYGKHLSMPDARTREVLGNDQSNRGATAANQFYSTDGSSGENGADPALEEETAVKNDTASKSPMLSNQIRPVKRAIGEAKELLAQNEWNGIQTWTIRNDFRHVLSSMCRRMRLSDEDERRVKEDPVTKTILRAIDDARKEPLKLLEAGMSEEEIARARPDLVMVFGDIRNQVNSNLRKMIGEGKHMEALAYYASAKPAFEHCEMHSLERPDFSGKDNKSVARPAATRAPSVRRAE